MSSATPSKQRPVVSTSSGSGDDLGFNDPLNIHASQAADDSSTSSASVQAVEDTKSVQTLASLNFSENGAIICGSSDDLIRYWLDPTMGGFDELFQRTMWTSFPNYAFSHEQFFNALLDSLFASPESEADRVNAFPPPTQADIDAGRHKLVACNTDEEKRAFEPLFALRKRHVLGLLQYWLSNFPQDLISTRSSPPFGLVSSLSSSSSPNASHAMSAGPSPSDSSSLLSSSSSSKPTIDSLLRRSVSMPSSSSSSSSSATTSSSSSSSAQAPVLATPTAASLPTTGSIWSPTSADGTSSSSSSSSSSKPSPSATTTLASHRLKASRLSSLSDALDDENVDFNALNEDESVADIDSDESAGAGVSEPVIPTPIPAQALQRRNSFDEEPIPAALNKAKSPVILSSTSSCFASDFPSSAIPGLAGADVSALSSSPNSSASSPICKRGSSLLSEQMKISNSSASGGGGIGGGAGVNPNGASSSSSSSSSASASWAGFDWDPECPDCIAMMSTTEMAPMPDQIDESEAGGNEAGGADDQANFLGRFNLMIGGAMDDAQNGPSLPLLVQNILQVGMTANLPPFYRTIPSIVPLEPSVRSRKPHRAATFVEEIPEEPSPAASSSSQSAPVQMPTLLELLQRTCSTRVWPKPSWGCSIDTRRRLQIDFARFQLLVYAVSQRALQAEAEGLPMVASSFSDVIKQANSVDVESIMSIWSSYSSGASTSQAVLKSLRSLSFQSSSSSSSSEKLQSEKDTSSSSSSKTFSFSPSTQQSLMKLPIVSSNNTPPKSPALSSARPSALTAQLKAATSSEHISSPSLGPSASSSSSASASSGHSASSSSPSSKPPRRYQCQHSRMHTPYHSDSIKTPSSSVSSYSTSTSSLRSNYSIISPPMQEMSLQASSTSSAASVLSTSVSNDTFEVLDSSSSFTDNQFMSLPSSSGFSSFVNSHQSLNQQQAANNQASSSGRDRRNSMALGSISQPSASQFLMGPSSSSSVSKIAQIANSSIAQSSPTSDSSSSSSFPISSSYIPPSSIGSSSASNRRGSVSGAIVMNPKFLQKFVSQQSSSPFLLAMSVEEMSNQMVLLEYSLLRSINVRELLKTAWMKDGWTRAPTVQRHILHFNRLATWVGTEILLAPNSNVRTKVLSLFLRLAEHCILHSHNFSAAFAIISGLNSNAIYRMKKLWASLGSKDEQRWQFLQKFTSTTANFGAYRQSWQAAVALNELRIPHLGVLLKDLCAAEEAPTMTKDGRVNALKLMKLSDLIQTSILNPLTQWDEYLQIHQGGIVAAVLDDQGCNVNFSSSSSSSTSEYVPSLSRPRPQINERFEVVVGEAMINCKTDDEMYRISLQIEPRE